MDLGLLIYFETSVAFRLDLSLTEDMKYHVSRFAPSPDPSLSIKFYERTSEQQSTLGYVVESSQTGSVRDAASTEAVGTSDQVQRAPHGSIGAAAGHRAIAQSNSAEIAESLFRYTAPEEVHNY